MHNKNQDVMEVIVISHNKGGSKFLQFFLAEIFSLTFKRFLLKNIIRVMISILPCRVVRQVIISQSFTNEKTFEIRIGLSKCKLEMSTDCFLSK